MVSPKKDREKPFATLFKAKLPKGDIRLPLIQQLVHELEGVIPPYGDLKEKLLWAEIGVILPGDMDMVWICIPNSKSDDDDFRNIYKKAISKGKQLKFSYNKLTKALHDEDAKSVHKSLKKIIKVHFITVQKGCETHCRIECERKEISCSHENKSKAACHDECLAMTSVLKLKTQDHFCDWFDFVKDKFKDKFKLKSKIAHTFFVILKPGSYFHSDIKRLQENIIGGALFHWDESPPSDEEILFLRRNIMNTLWAELGSRLRLLNLSSFAAQAIPAMIQFTSSKNAFARSVYDIDHNDKSCATRKNICKIISSKNTKCEACLKQKPINKKNIVEDNITVLQNDFCGSLDEYKGMFQRNGTEIYMADSTHTEYDITSQKALFHVMASFLGLSIIIPQTVTKITLPYGPSWLFLATIRLLSDALKVSEITLDKDISEPKWRMNIFFPVKVGEKLNTCAEALKKRIESNENKGEASSAILDVLHGRLGAMKEAMMEWHPDDPVVKNLCSEKSEKPLMKYEIDYCSEAGKMVLCLLWN